MTAVAECNECEAVGAMRVVLIEKDENVSGYVAKHRYADNCNDIKCGPDDQP